MTELVVVFGALSRIRLGDGQGFLKRLLGLSLSMVSPLPAELGRCEYVRGVFEQVLAAQRGKIYMPRDVEYQSQVLPPAREAAELGFIRSQKVCGF